MKLNGFGEKINVYTLRIVEIVFLFDSYLVGKQANAYDMYKKVPKN